MANTPTSPRQKVVDDQIRYEQLIEATRREQATVFATGASKLDGGKLRYDLIPTAPEREVARAFTIGAAKYGERNWEAGFAYSRLYSACRRHLAAWWAGERSDPDDGHHHLSAVVACAMMLIELETTHPEHDNRPETAAVAS